MVYRTGYRAARVWWRIRKPKGQGVGILVRHGDNVLAVLHSYRPGYTLPGGSVGRNEKPRDTAVRELAEELSIVVQPEDLTYVKKLWRSHIFELRFDEEPDIRIDHREIVDAVFLPAEEAARRYGIFRQLV